MTILYKIIYYLGTHCLLSWMPSKLYLQCAYKRRTGTNLNLLQPKTFNEKLQWLKLHDRRPEYTMMADKYAVRKHIAETIGEEYLIPLLGVWEDPDEIDFNALPDQFVLKCNHNSGKGMCICKDKSKLNIDDVKRELRKGLKQNYFLTRREWPYKHIPRKIVAEKYMEDSDGELKDYKFFCFNGKVKFYKIDFDRFIRHRANYYDLNNNILPFGEAVCPPDFDRRIEIPTCINDMILLAEKLSAGYPFLRVDLYCVKGQIYFGELTFYPASGFGKFIPESYDLKLGNELVLPIR